MATLSGQSIQNTYKGLLKLSTSTTGITSSLQAVEDGLGNNTGIKIATNQFYQQNTIPSMNISWVPDYMGPGFTTTTVAPSATQNRILYSLFYDPGLHDYSAITYNVVSATSTSDTFEWAFYDLQWVNSYGLAPRNVIQSGITLNIASTGVKVTSLPSTLSFSGYGGGYFMLVSKVTNSGVTPTFRLGTALNTTWNQQYVNLNYGLCLNNAQNATSGPQRIGTGNLRQYTNLTTFNNPYTSADISGNWSNVSITEQLGWAFNTIR